MTNQADLKRRMEEMKRQKNDGFKSFPKYFMGTGLLLLVIAGVILALDYRFVSQAYTTEGVVTGLHGSGRRSGFAPDIRYEVNGKAYMFYSEEYSRPPRFLEGDKVTIYYLPADPSTANMGIQWIVLSIVGGLGVFFLGMGYLFHKFM